jgi:NADPH:quinone reductase-like Zn-dependent oxidoreductase
MKAVVLKKVSPIEKEPLEMIDLPDPVPGPEEILVKLPVLPHGASSQLRRNPPKHIYLR